MPRYLSGNDIFEWKWVWKRKHMKKKQDGYLDREVICFGRNKEKRKTWEVPYFSLAQSLKMTEMFIFQV